MRRRLGQNLDVEVLWHYVPHTGQVIIEQRQPDVSALLDRNAALATHHRVIEDPVLGRYVGEVPLTMLSQWRKLDPDLKHDPARIRAWLNQRDYRRFKTVKGRA